MRCAFVTASLLIGSLGSAASGDDTKTIKVSPRRADDAIAIGVEEGRTVVAVTSPFGISRAVIERTGVDWPEFIVLRLHLSGLERLRVSSGTIAISASAAADGSEVRVWKTNREDAPLDPTSPFWLVIRPHAGDWKPAKGSPLKGRYFEVEISKAFFEGNPKSVTIEWIDFFR